jgi:hypothetical protein
MMSATKREMARKIFTASITAAADRLLGAFVPRATAAAFSCPSGYYRVTCFCGLAPNQDFVWYDKCCQDNGPNCHGCAPTARSCA